MVSDRRRILELALESLESRKKEIEQEIAEITSEIKGRPARRALALKRSSAAARAAARKKPRFSREEKLRRSQRMKAYWENWRKKKAHSK